MKYANPEAGLIQFGLFFALGAARFGDRMQDFHAGGMLLP